MKGQGISVQICSEDLLLSGTMYGISITASAIHSRSHVDAGQNTTLLPSGATIRSPFERSVPALRSTRHNLLSPRSVNSNGHVTSPVVTAAAACDSVAVAARAAARVAKVNVHSFARALAAPLRLVGPPLRAISAASTGRDNEIHSCSANCPGVCAREPGYEPS